MNKRSFVKAILDGTIQGLILFCLLLLDLSKYTLNWSIKQYLTVALCGAIFSSCVYFFLIFKESNLKGGIFFFIISVVSFAIVMLILLILYLNVNFFSLRELNNADGILLLLNIGCFILSSFILRIGIFATWIINKKLKNIA